MKKEVKIFWPTVLLCLVLYLCLEGVVSIISRCERKERTRCMARVDSLYKATLSTYEISCEENIFYDSYGMGDDLEELGDAISELDDYILK